MDDTGPKADAADDGKKAIGSGKLPQSQRPGGKKRMVAAFVAFVGAGYSVSPRVAQSPHLGWSLTHRAMTLEIHPSLDSLNTDGLRYSICTARVCSTTLASGQ